MLRVCGEAQKTLREVSSFAEQIVLPPTISEATGIDNWQEKFRRFEIDDVRSPVGRTRTLPEGAVAGAGEC